jgi:hypothetical protein
MIIRIAAGQLRTRFGTFWEILYYDGEQEMIALVMGKVQRGEEVLCRLHSHCLAGHVFNSAAARGEQGVVTPSCPAARRGELPGVGVLPARRAGHSGGSAYVVRPQALLRALLVEACAGMTALAAVLTLQTLASLEVLVALGLSLAATSYMSFVTRDLGFATGVLGLIFASGGIGALLGAVLAPRLDRRFSSGGDMLLGLSCLALGMFCIPLTPSATPGGTALLITHQVVGDGGHIVYDVHDRTLRQTAVSPDLLARRGRMVEGKPRS